MKTNHTPLPWNHHSPVPWNHKGSLVFAQQNPGGIKTHIAECFRDVGSKACEANAALIVKAVNCHQELVEACRQAAFAIPTTHAAFQTVRAALKSANGPTTKNASNTKARLE